MEWTGSGVIRMGHRRERDRSSVNWEMMGKLNMFCNRNIMAYYKYDYHGLFIFKFTNNILIFPVGSV